MQFELLAGVERPLFPQDLRRDQDNCLLPIEVETKCLSMNSHSLFSTPAWVRHTNAERIVIIEGDSDLVFERRKGGLFHLGRLLWISAECLKLVSQRLLELDDVKFVVFEDMVVEGTPGGLHRTVYQYQNNWQLTLGGGLPAKPLAKQTAQATARKLRSLKRDRPNVRLTFHQSPSLDLLRTIVAYNKAKIASQGRHHGIDERELYRLHATAGEIGWASVLEDENGVIAGDLVFIAGRRAYFVTGGYDHSAHRYSPGMITLIHAIEACRERGIVDFNLLWGDGEYKKRLGARCLTLSTVVTRRSAWSLFYPSYFRVASHFGWRQIRRQLKPLLSHSLTEWVTNLVCRFRAYASTKTVDTT